MLNFNVLMNYYPDIYQFSIQNRPRGGGLLGARPLAPIIQLAPENFQQMGGPL